MIRVEHTHRFGVPLGQGFQYITDITNWPEYWPGLVRVEADSHWSTPGDEARLVMKLLGREVLLRMTLTRLVAGHIVEYESLQNGLPNARHERHFTESGDGFDYRLVVEYEPRSGVKGWYDRLLVGRGIARALRQTVGNLDVAFAGRRS